MKTEFYVEFAGKSYPCFFINTKEKALAVIEKLKAKTGILAADTETAALPEWRHIGSAALSPFLSNIRLLQLFTGTGAVVIDLHATGPIDLKSLFENRPSVFHNMTFDYKFLRKHYNVVDPDMHCTCIMARCVFHAIYPENKSASLKDVATALFGEVINKKAGASDWSVPNLTFEQIEYAARDAIVQMRIYEKLSEYIDKLELRKVYDLYRKAQIAICEMELNGLLIDREAHIKNVSKWRQDLCDAKESVLQLTKIKNITDSNIAEYLEKTLPAETLDIWPRTEKTMTGKGGKLSTDSNTFVDFSYLDIVKPFSTFQKLKKLTTSFGVNLLQMVNPATGRLHPTYRVAGAKTGRLSCTEPNIQQQPRSKEMRSVYIPSPGYVMLAADYGQIEVRYIAELSQDPEMLHAFEEGIDIYSYTVAGIQGKPVAEVTKAERQSGKALVLGLSYGLGAKKYAHYAKKGYGVDVTKEESSALVDSYRKLYSGLRDWQLEQVNKCAAHMYTAFSAMGKSRRMTEDDYYGACMNHPVQGGCAEIMLLALVKTRDALKGTSARLLASVHDEIILECLPEEVDEIKKVIVEQMTEAYTDIVPNPRTLRKLVDPSTGNNWAEAKS